MQPRSRLHISATLSSLGGLAALALGTACVADPPSGPSGELAATSQAVLGVAAPSASPNERVGIYVSQVDRTGFGFGDLVNGPAGLVTQIGAKVVRVFLSNPDKYTGEIYGSLAAEAQTGPYVTLFSSPNFDTYLLTAYSAPDNPSNGCAPTWLNGLSPAAAQAETVEIQQLAQTLSARYPSKKFILLNWEGDSAIGSLAHYCVPRPPQTEAMWQGFTDWINARVQGVLNARGQGVTNVFSGLEINALQRTDDDDYYGNSCAPQDAGSLAPGCAWCDATHKCVVSRVLPNVPNVDYVSYSAWQSVGVPNDGDVGARLQNDLTRARGFAPGAAPANFLVGELGIDRFSVGEARAASRMTSAINAMTAWGVSYGVYWQILDNAPSGPGNGFGAYEPSGALGAVGQMLHGLYAPTIAGVVDDTNGVVGTAHPGGFISLYGTNYGASNLVFVGGVQASVSYNSPTQINAIVPAVASGVQTVQVYNPATGQSAFTSVTVIGAPSVTCSFSAASTIATGGSWSVSVTSNPAGYAAYWYGTHNGAVDATNVFAGTTNLFTSYGPFFNRGEWYTRYAVLRDGAGNPVCTTNTITVSVQ